VWIGAGSRKAPAGAKDPFWFRESTGLRQSWSHGEAGNDDLKDVLPKTYNRLHKELVVSLLEYNR
jgi:hypothetical protein